MTRRKQRGMTLVELLVAMLIALGIVLATTTLLISSESHKRVTTSTNDEEQTGAYAFYELQKVLNGAGSAIAESAFPSDRGLLGCRLNAALFFPRNAAFPAPFTGFLPGTTSNLRIAPLLIAQNQSDGGSDVIMVMGGSGAAGGVSRQVTGAGASTTIVLDNTVGFNPQDVALISQSGVTDCLLEEVGSIAAPVLTVSGTTYYTQNGVTTNLATLTSSTSSYVTPIGNATANNIQFTLFGVGLNRTLYSYDLLQNLNLVGGVGGDSSQAIADGVVQMNAIYGIDNNGDGIQDVWAGPGDPGWDINTVMSSPTLMRQIVSVHVALVVRGEYYDRNNGNPVSPPSLTIFPGLASANGPLTQIINLSLNDRNYRYRVFEFTVPLRNMLLLASGGA